MPVVRDKSQGGLRPRPEPHREAPAASATTVGRSPVRDDGAPKTAGDARAATPRWRNPYDAPLSSLPAVPPAPARINPVTSFTDGEMRVVWPRGARRPPSPEQVRADRLSAKFLCGWKPRLEQLRQDPSLLATCLDDALQLPPGTPAIAQLLYHISPLADALGVGAHGLRAALELVDLWPLPDKATPPADGLPVLLGARLIHAAILYSAAINAGRVYTAVRGGDGYGHRGRKWTALPWSILRPLATLKGYDDRVITGGPSAISYGPPHELTYRTLPGRARELGTTLFHLQKAQAAMRRLRELSTQECRRPLDGDAQISTSGQWMLNNPITPEAALTLKARRGTGVRVTASVPARATNRSPFVRLDAGRHLIAGSARARITAVVSETEAVVDILTPFTTTGPIAPGAWGVERISREHLQHMVNAERESELDRYLRVGDRIVDVPLLDDLSSSLDACCERVGDWVAATKRLVGARPSLVARGGHAVGVYRAIAAEVAKRINGALPDSRLRNHSTTSKPGLYRQEVLDRAAAIVLAVYGVTMPPKAVKLAASKRRTPAD